MYYDFWGGNCPRCPPTRYGPGCVIGIGISLEFRLPLRISCVCPGYWLGTASPVVEPSFKILLVYFGLLKSNLSIVRRLASLRIHGCSGVIVCSVSPTNVYVLARHFLCPVSCLTCAAAQFLKKAVPADAVYNSKASVLLVSQSPCQCKIYGMFTSYT